MTELVKRSAAWMARAVGAREVSAAELLEAHAERIGARNPEINAIVVSRLDRAREDANAADLAVVRGDRLGALHGVPFTAKEVIAVAGLPCTNGSLLLAGRVAARDAEVIRRMRAAGAILVGKTNLSEFSAFWDSVNRVYGTTRNPHDLARSVGGSSGGEAAALAAAMTPLGIGSDLAGSVRAPAHWTGVLALRASREALTPYIAEMVPGLLGLEPSFDAYVAAFAQIAEIDAAATAWFERHPVALCPITSDVAPPVGVFTFPPVDGELIRPGGKLSLCTYASALGLPALAVPVMRSTARLPVGVQLIARRGEDRTLIALAARLEEAFGGWLDPDAT